MGGSFLLLWSDLWPRPVSQPFNPSPHLHPASATRTYAEVLPQVQSVCLKVLSQEKTYLCPTHLNWKHIKVRLIYLCHVGPEVFACGHLTGILHSFLYRPHPECVNYDFSLVSLKYGNNTRYLWSMLSTDSLTFPFRTALNSHLIWQKINFFSNSPLLNLSPEYLVFIDTSFFSVSYLHFICLYC